jgi:serine protease AprX
VVRWCAVIRAGLAASLVCALAGATPAYAARAGDHPKLDKHLNERASKGGTTKVIVILKPGWSADTETKKLGGKLGRSLGLINGKVVELSNGQLKKLADYAGVERIVYDRPTAGELNRVAVTVGARAVQQSYGYRGAGIGVAVLDSGITSWHADLSYLGSSSLVRTKNGQRVAAFVDLVNGRTSPYDDNGHGTHVSGIIGGNGFDTLGSRAGIAPDAHILSLKVLDAQGRGVISNVIAALDWVVANRAAYNVRVVNLSVGAAVTESYKTDPLTLAAKRAVDAGIVVVTAAGNLGKNRLGQLQYGAIAAPGNAPWVLTVGASSHEGTVSRTDDVIAGFSSRGPSAVDFEAKPDVVAPGVGTASLSDPLSLIYETKVSSLLGGSFWLGYKPYISLSGTSMSAPVVAGSVALMLQANPSLTPNLVKAILQYTAQASPEYNALTQGAGFLNTKGAVDLARFFRTARAGQPYPQASEWSKKLIWGNHRISKGLIKPNAPAWKLGVVWGAAKTPSGANVAWGTRCGNSCNNQAWSSLDSEDNIVWGTASASEDNIVWGTFAEFSDDNVVWGTVADDEDNIVWGTDCAGANCPNVIWGSAMSEDNIVWGTASGEDNVVWGTASGEDNVVWGTASGEDNVVWGTASDEDNLVWGTSDGEDTPLFDDPNVAPESFDLTVWDNLFGETVVDPVEPVATAVEPVTTAITTTTTTVKTLLGGLGGGL